MRLRNKWFEREATTEAGRSVDTDGLNRFAEARADAGGPHRPDQARSMRREVMEELADARNYIVWWMEDVVEGFDDADPIQLREALGAVAHAFGVIGGAE